MPRPNIQIDDEVREMTEEEYAVLIESGWTEIAPEEAPTE
jgi:Arc/MetJ family transcription regulator